MPITELNHYLLVAKNLEKTKKFYQQVLGLKLAARPDFGFPGYWLKAGGDICVHLGCYFRRNWSRIRFGACEARCTQMSPPAFSQ